QPGDRVGDRPGGADDRRGGDRRHEKGDAHPVHDRGLDRTPRAVRRVPLAGRAEYIEVMSLLWINGQLIDKADARVSPFDHGFLYGDGIWEHFRVFGGELFRPEEGVRCLFTYAHNVSI